MALPFDGSTSSSVPALHVVNTGAGYGIQVQSAGAGFNGAAVQATNGVDGGLAIYAYGISTSGTTALITNDSQSGGDIIQGWNQGGIRFHVDTSGNLSTVGAINASSATITAPGSGPALVAQGALFGMKGAATGNSGAGVLGVGAGTSFGVVGNSASADGLRGISTSSNGAHGMSTGSNGVQGETTASGASGVYGQNSNAGGYGVYGRNTAGGYGIGTDGNAFQTRAQGGFVKAMAYIRENAQGGPGIVRCFNSQLPAPQATTPPCGITYGEPATGTVKLTMNFETEDRFYVVTNADGDGGVIVAACSGSSCVATGIPNNEIDVRMFVPTNNQLFDVPFNIVVF